VADVLIPAVCFDSGGCRFVHGTDFCINRRQN